MTETGKWLDRRRRELARRTLGAGLLLTVGFTLFALGVGVLLGFAGIYQLLPPAVLFGWIGAVVALAWGVRWYRRRRRATQAGDLAREVEMSGGLREGSIRGLAEWVPASGSSSLAALADTRASGWLDRHGSDALASVQARSSRHLRAGGVTLLAGATLFFVSGMMGGAGNPFWHPLATVLGARGPVRLAVDRTEVRRGDSVRVTITSVGRRAAQLWLREPGEPWDARVVQLDSAGRSLTVIGPLDSDRFIRATSGGRSSDTVRVRVQLPAFLSDLQLVARYPDYLERPDEPLAPSPDAVPLPVGTLISTRGRATVALGEAAWHAGERTVRLATDGESFSGRLRVTRSGHWVLGVRRLDGSALDEDSPELNIVAIPDSAPIIAVPVPGADTTAPITLRQPLVIDVRDDHGLSSVELVSWRVSRFGDAGEPVIEPLPLPAGETDRAVLQWILDLNGRGFLPGDTAYFKARAIDDAPAANVGESETFRLRLPSMADLRAATRENARALSQSTDSLVQAQRELARDIEDLSAERERETDGSRAGSRTPEEMPFNSVERARELSERQQDAIERAQELQRELRDLADDAWSAGLTDPEFQRQMMELQDLLDRAVSEELEERLRQLREAIEQLDADAVREALKQLAEAADQLREELERGRELFERAAIEGEMTTLAEDAEELAAQQQEWNQQAGQQLDSSLASTEEELAARADSLAAQLQQLSESLEQTGESANRTQQSAERADRASQQMRQAAAQAQQGQQQGAQQSGQQASQSLDPLAEELREQRDQLRQQWKEEVLEQMDRALVDVASLAKQEQAIADRLNNGEGGADVRGEQAATRAGVDQVIERLQDAAGKNAQVSPQLGNALGYSKLRMSQALEQLQRPNPNVRQAGEMASEALDGLNAVAHQLLRSRADVAGAQSGSGLAEALEQLAQMAEQQGAMNNEANGMLPMMSVGGQQLLQQLQQLADRQRSLSDELQRMAAEGDVSGAEDLADEAREVARELEAGRLDRPTIERQERLFRRLLDAGRSLRSEEDDERKERVSETADQFNVQLPSGAVASPGAPRFRYPGWSELRTLTPEERRLVLDYFRRLNEGRR